MQLGSMGHFISDAMRTQIAELHAQQFQNQAINTSKRGASTALVLKTDQFGTSNISANHAFSSRILPGDLSDPTRLLQLSDKPANAPASTTPGTCPAVDQCPIDDGMTGTCPVPVAGYLARAYDAAAPYALPMLGAAVLASALYAGYSIYSTRQEAADTKSAREAFEGRITDLGLVSMNKAANALGGLAGQFASRARFALAIVANLAGILTNAGKVAAAATVATVTIGYKSAFGGVGKNVARLSLSAANTGIAAAGVAIPELARFTLEGEYKLAGIEANRVDRAIYAAAG